MNISGTNAFSPASISAGQNRASSPLSATQNSKKTVSDQELTEEEKKQVQELKQTDEKVRAHEQAHKTVGGPYTGPISYETTTGPDGRQYAVGGEVAIDTSPAPNNPKATVRKMDVVVRAALAPADPSPQDFAVARAAQGARLQAQREVREQQEAEQTEVRGENDDASQPASKSADRTGNQGGQQPIAEISQAIQNLNQSQQLSAEAVEAIFTAII